MPMGGHRDGAGLAEITGVLPARALTGYPCGMRVIVRRERPHPGAQLDAFEERDGWRYTAFATDTRVGQLARLDARHRAHARVEDRSAAPRTPASIISRRGSSRSTPPGWSWTCSPSTSSPGPGTCSCTAIWPGQSRRRCATGCSTSPPDSPADSAESGCAFNAPGRGPATWQPRSPGSPRCPSRPADLPSRHNERREPPSEQQAGHLPMPAPM